MSKNVRFTIITLLVVLGFVLSFLAGCILVPGQRPGLSTVEQAWNTILTYYVEKDKLDTTKLSQAAIRGMVEALNDPYTAYLDPEAYKLGLSDLEGNFEGIGARVDLRDGKVTITSPLPDSPAERAGIRAGDVVLEIGGESTEGMSVTEAVLRVRGPKGTVVRLLVQHEGEAEPVLIEITRAEISMPSVRSETRGEFAYISIFHFVASTERDLLPVVSGLAQSGAKGIILDLRGNPGGLVDSVVGVASYFIRSGVILEVVDNQGRRTTYEARRQPVTTDLPMAVLVDENSASGAEVLAGALQDSGRATIAGTKTFGKGSVNQLYQLSDGAGIYLTTARWLTPKGRLIEGEGIEPDHVLTQTGEDAITWAIDYLKGRSGVRRGYRELEVALVG